MSDLIDKKALIEALTDQSGVYDLNGCAAAAVAIRCLLYSIDKGKYDAKPEPPASEYNRVNEQIEDLKSHIEWVNRRVTLRVDDIDDLKKRVEQIERKQSEPTLKYLCSNEYIPCNGDRSHPCPERCTFWNGQCRKLVEVTEHDKKQA